MKRVPKRVVGVVFLLIFSSLSFSGSSAEDHITPCIHLQGQTSPSIGTRETITLYAQGSDETALQSAWLETNETGTWEKYALLPTWQYAKHIIIHHAFIDEDCTDFPVLLTCTFPDFITNAQTDGDDFVFTDITSTIQYAHEIESYNSLTGELVAWVKIPFLSSIQDTVMLLQYGNPTCTNQQHREETWNHAFSLIHHLTGASYTDLDDSTSSGWDITSIGGNPAFNQPGKIGYCVDFDGSNDYLKTDGFRLGTDDSYTASAWVYVDGNAEMRRYIFEGDADASISLQVWTNNTFKTRTHTSDAWPVCYSTTPVTVLTPRWQYVTTRLDSEQNHLDILVNGNVEATKTITGTVNPETEGLLIGTEMNALEFWMNGKIDELRFSSVVRSDAWIHTEYSNMMSPTQFATITDWYPLPLQPTTDLQWANFTWCNPTLTESQTIGWRIFFKDTSGNINTTPIQTFTILSMNHAPPTPVLISGSTTTSVGTSCAYMTEPVLDPDTDTVTYKFDWGDGTTSEWKTTPTATHAWSTPGTYDVTVKAKDSHDEESTWSLPLIVSVLQALPELSVDVSQTVIEGTDFIVTVSSDQTPIADAQVEFLGALYMTNQTGSITLVAPSVQSTARYSFTVSKEGYQTVTTVVTILNSEELLAQAWIYGVITDEAGRPIEGAAVCAYSSSATTPICAGSTAEGKYTIMVTVGTYSLEVIKSGYRTGLKHTIAVQQNEAVGVNIRLTRSENTTTDQRTTFLDYAIEYGVREGIVGGEISVSGTQESDTVVYDARVSLSVMSTPDEHAFRCTVSGPSSANGTVLALRIDNPEALLKSSVEQLNDITVEYDGVPIKKANDSLDVFGPLANSTEPVWAGLLTEKLYVLIVVPEFSDHEISVHVAGVDTVFLVSVYSVVGFIIVAVLLTPLLMNIVRRRRSFR